MAINTAMVNPENMYCQKSIAETAFCVLGPGAAMPIVIAVGTQPSSKITNWIMGSSGSQPFACMGGGGDGRWRVFGRSVSQCTDASRLAPRSRQTVPRRLTIQKRETPRHTKGKTTSRTIVTTPTEGMSTRSELVPWAKLHPSRRVIRGKHAVPTVLHEFMAHPNGAPLTNSALSGGVRPTARPAAAATLTGSVSILTTIEGWPSRFSSSSLHEDSSSAATLGGGRARW
mmetsp:Transcript_23939/g.64730  ORF Transcript_23939/g.64730 Transcript_23939/m.64730 type:complete len:229 (+) Transcript_23939:143-829(+)